MTSGAVSIFGSEKDFALDVCLRAKGLLEGKGLKVVMTRSNDTFIPLEQRPTVGQPHPQQHLRRRAFQRFRRQFAGQRLRDLFHYPARRTLLRRMRRLSLRDLHGEPGNVTDAASLALSESIYYSLLGNIPQVDRGVKHARFAVIRLAQVPAVLIEGGFVSSSSEVRQIATPAYRQKLAESIVTGIEGFKALAEHKVPPKLRGRLPPRYHSRHVRRSGRGDQRPPPPRPAPLPRSAPERQLASAAICLPPAGSFPDLSAVT